MNEKQIIKFLEEESDLALREGFTETARKLSEAAELIRRLVKCVDMTEEYLQLP